MFQILRISMYFANGHEAENNPDLKSQRGRVFYHHGYMDVENILQMHIDGRYEIQEDGQAIQGKKRKRGRLLVAGIEFSDIRVFHN